MTLYGRTKETYESITGVPGSYERCLQGIGLLRERGLPLMLKTMAMTLNRREIWEMKRFAEEDLGLQFKFDAMIKPRIDRGKGPLAFRLSPEEIVELEFQNPKCVEGWRELATRPTGSAPSNWQGCELYHCGNGITGFAIDPYGDLKMCVISMGETWDLRRGSFQEGWENWLSGVRHKKIAGPSKCVTCGITALCGMCPASGDLENGDPELPVAFYCQVAHLRAYGLGLTVPPHGDCEYCLAPPLKLSHLSGIGRASCTMGEGCEFNKEVSDSG
jgi:radical SAM protein with 4Fe4S-binding SPASM domain